MIKYKKLVLILLLTLITVNTFAKNVFASEGDQSTFKIICNCGGLFKDCCICKPNITPERIRIIDNEKDSNSGELVNDSSRKSEKDTFLNKEVKKGNI